ncbi:MAG TPA: 4-hydroxy-tetrahydrodipicolinate reductase [Candidatus Paceibacterota bacterium]
MNIGIIGKKRMGTALVAAVKNHPDLTIVGQIGREGNLLDFLTKTDVVIDFSSPDTSLLFVMTCDTYNRPLVLGTTGQSEEVLGTIDKLSLKIPVIMATNFSVGANLLFWLAQKSAEILGPNYDPEIVEVHHRLKKDAPSGTAKTLAGALGTIRQSQLDAPAMFRRGREGITGERNPREIGIHSVRGGSVVGDHTVMFLGGTEAVKLSHEAFSREVFADGALRAARWVVKQKPGLYDMQDVLGLK